MDQCPDKWRRYHSTTTADQEVLDISFKVNPRVYCSICARKGHFAENCSQFNKAISGLITSSPIKIISNKPSYNKELVHENHQVLQLMTFMDCYKFNFNLPQNCQLYPKFRELFKKHQFEMFTKLQAIQEEPKIRKRVKKKKSESAVIEEINESSLVLNVTQNSSESLTLNQSTSQTLSVTLDDSNSNYSFSDFYVDRNARPNDENQNQNALLPSNSIVPDFIPLHNNNRLSSPIERISNRQIISDAKIMLTKEHATFLMTKDGQNFVVDLGTQFNITSQFNWDSAGNSLVIKGLMKNQEKFHSQIRTFLYKFEIEEQMNKLLKSTQAPRIRLQLINYIQTNLKMIRKVPIKEARKNLNMLISAEREMDYKKTLKFRKCLNIIFMGYMQLREGAFHVGELKKILDEQKKEVSNGKGEISIDQRLRDEINNHIRYIFSSIDHGDYNELFRDFQKTVHERQEMRTAENNANSSKQIIRR
jgi:hypothetical protein